MFDTVAHNAEASEVWASYNAGAPIRMPVILGFNTRFWLLNREFNKTGMDFRQYTEAAHAMLEGQMALRHLMATELNKYCDEQVGIPEAGLDAFVDFQNFFEAAWFGCEVIYPANNVPGTHPLLTDDKKNYLFEKGIPDPFSGWLKKGQEYYEYFAECKQRGFTWQGIPIREVGVNYLYTDGPFTNACNLRGTAEFCADIYDDPQYAERLLDYITDATIARITAWRRYLGRPEKYESFSFADDSAQLISPRMYKRLVLPRHKRLAQALSTGEDTNAIHMCGDATHLFEILRDELNVYDFDTGYPVDFSTMTEKLGSKVRMNGGVHVDVLLGCSAAEVTEETVKIIRAVKPHTKRFVMRDANNVAPFTPLANLDAMYQAVRAHGRY